MTNEKAIEVIKQNCYVSNLLDLDETVMINTALDRAVDALNKTSDKELIKQFKSIVRGDCIMLTKEAYSDLCMRGMDKEYFEWVPTSERLPELREDVLVSLKNGRFFVCALFPGSAGQKYWWIGEEEIHFLFDDVVAWRPLPEQYKEDNT